MREPIITVQISNGKLVFCGDALFGSAELWGRILQDLAREVARRRSCVLNESRMKIHDEIVKAFNSEFAAPTAERIEERGIA